MFYTDVTFFRFGHFNFPERWCVRTYTTEQLFGFCMLGKQPGFCPVGQKDEGCESGHARRHYIFETFTTEDNKTPPDMKTSFACCVICVVSSLSVILGRAEFVKLPAG